MRNLEYGDVVTIEQLLAHFDQAIVTLNETRRNLLAAGVTLANDELFVTSRVLHHIWMATLDLTNDAYASSDLVEIR